jgi:hypothetical protein
MTHDRPVTLAAIAGAHGVTGEVRLKLFGEGVAALKPTRRSTGHPHPVKLRDDGKGGAIARFAEVTTRNAAESLRSTALTVPRAALPPLAEGEYYHADLIGLPAHSTDGTVLARAWRSTIMARATCSTSSAPMASGSWSPCAKRRFPNGTPSAWSLTRSTHSRIITPPLGRYFSLWCMKRGGMWFLRSLC